LLPYFRALDLLIVMSPRRYEDRSWWADVNGPRVGTRSRRKWMIMSRGSRRGNQVEVFRRLCLFLSNQSPGHSTRTHDES
jgi:hypothetical protein